MQCFRDMHQQLPLHRVEHWSGTHFEPAWLCQVGVTIQLGHHGHPCPTRSMGLGTNHKEDDGITASGSSTDNPLDDPEVDDSEDEDEWDSDGEDEYFADPQVRGPSALPDLQGLDVMTVVDISGIHKIRVRPCTCIGCLPLDIQLIRMGFFPTSFKMIKTIITFKILEDQRLDNLECKTPMLKYWNKLKRKTSAHQWPTVPVGDIFI